MQRVEMLALIFVQALDLNVKDGIGIHHGAIRLFEIAGRALLVLALDLLQLPQRRAVVRQRQQLFQLGRVGQVPAADMLFQKSREAGIGLGNPAAVGNAVGDVGKLAGHLLVKVPKDGFL